MEPPVAVKTEDTDNAESNKAEVNAMRFLLDGLVDSTGDEVDAEKSLGNVRQRDGGKWKCRPFRLVKKRQIATTIWRQFQSFFFSYPARPFPQIAFFQIQGNLLRKSEQVWTPTQ